MILLTFTVDSDKIFGSEPCPGKLPHIPADTINFVKFQFKFVGNDWKGTTRTVLFKNASFDKTYEMPVMPDGACKVPWEVIAHPGTLLFTVKGFIIDELGTLSYRVLAGPYQLIVDKDNMLEAFPSLPPTPTEYEQFVINIGEYANVAIEASKQSCECADRSSEYAGEAQIAFDNAFAAAKEAISSANTALEARRASENIKSDVKVISDNVSKLSKGVEENAEKASKAYNDAKFFADQSSKSSAFAKGFRDETEDLFDKVSEKTEVVIQRTDRVIELADIIEEDSKTVLQAAEDAFTYAHDADVSRTAAREYADDAEESRVRSWEHSVLSKSWAVGGTGTREGEDFDNAKYYAGQSHADQIQANWLEDDISYVSYIANRPFKHVGFGLIVNPDQDLMLNPDEVISERTDWNCEDTSADAYLINRPFRKIGKGLKLLDGDIILDEDALPNADWDVEDIVSKSFIKNKPFQTIGNGLQVIDGALCTGSNYYDKLVRKDEWLYEAFFSFLDYDYAYDYMETHYRGNYDGSLEKYGCSAFYKDGYFGKTFDWNFNWGAGIAIHTPASGSRHSVTGMANGNPKWSPEVLSKGEKLESYRLMPFMLNHGFNDSGFFVAMNVVTNDETKGGIPYTTPTTGTHPELTSRAICTMMLPRVLLDNCSNPEDAIEFIRTHNIFAPHSDLISDEMHLYFGNKYRRYVVEFINNTEVFTEVTNIHDYLTNYYISDAIFDADGFVDWHTLTDHPMGVGRGNEIAQFFKDHPTATEAQLFTFLLYDLAYTRAYRDAIWLDEFTGVTATFGNLTITDVMEHPEKFDGILEYSKNVFRNRSRDPESEFYGSWQSADACLYDLNRGILYASVQEQAVLYPFSLNYADYVTRTELLLEKESRIASDNELREDKLSKVTGISEHQQIYGKDSDGSQIMFDVSELVDIPGIPYRYADGTIAVNTKADWGLSAVNVDYFNHMTDDYLKATELIHKKITFVTTDDQRLESDLVYWDDSYLPD